jgi:hypothetical protein
MDLLHKKDGPWLHAWHDPVASIKAHSSCVRLADLNGESSHVLLVADLDRKMKVYKGTSVISEHQLLDQPVSLCVFYTDNSVPRTPAIGVAAGSYVFIYRHLRPYFKFNLPPIDIDQQVRTTPSDETSCCMAQTHDEPELLLFSNLLCVYLRSLASLPPPPHRTRTFGARWQPERSTRWLGRYC